MERIESIDDPRVATYRNLPDRTLRGESLFVTEGRLLTRRLLESPYETESVFLAEQSAAEFRPLVGDRAPIYVAPESVLREVVGFPFHLGVLGAGRRKTPPPLEALVGQAETCGRVSLVVCPEVSKPENLGLIARSANAFGVDGVILGERSCDPFSRRCLRLSMGAVLQLPLVKTADLRTDLRRLKDLWAVELVAAVVDPQAERLAEVCWSPRTGLVFGNEFEGLGGEWLTLCDRCVTIPMQPGVDSLNLGVAAGIFLYEWKGRKMHRSRPV